MGAIAVGIKEGVCKGVYLYVHIEVSLGSKEPL